MLHLCTSHSVLECCTAKFSCLFLSNKISLNSNVVFIFQTLLLKHICKVKVSARLKK